MSSLRNIGTRQTPQTERAREDQAVNNAGGFVFELDPFQKLRRFLILGTDGGTYYVNEHEHTRRNFAALRECVKVDGVKTVDTIVEISKGGRAPKNDYAIFALAYCAAHGDRATKNAAIAAIPHVCRIGTHIFQFAEFSEQFRGWGRSLKRGVASWYNTKSPDQLAYQVTKYRQRGGWSHRDLLRLSHARPVSAAHDAIFEYVTAEGLSQELYGRGSDVALNAFDSIMAAEEAKSITEPQYAAELVRGHGLTREMLNTAVLKDPRVWDALLQNMPMTAMIRNLGNMGASGLLVPMSAAVSTVVARLGDRERIKNARVHPIAILNALMTYKSGSGFRGSNTWPVVPQVVDALNEAFYLAFDNVTPSGKRTMLALDVSGSMGTHIGAMPNLTCREASAAMALVTARTEPNYMFTAFTSGDNSYWGRYSADALSPLNISAGQRLDDVIRAVSGLPFGGTDCAAPMMYALKHKLPIDVFIVYTDSETWAGNIQPFEALRRYREQMGIDAKLIVVGMVANDFSIADPNDAGMLDCVGFSTDTPEVISAFSRGEV